ncbi:DUF3052 family protein [Arcanobacterium hippocoleae]|uniref:DUF3052 domain-containing protein n=1 Tax=Arcanobacterium hippocoleae TaxID=149017 RepID=A0ABU1T0T3_9ACTO|nr:DUF3052 family protein [Arcanobacterium hippocoleae]MDR6938967.1 hypothetical protein [Arcanobacterium hippocoleae]
MAQALAGNPFGFQKGDVIQEFGYDEDVDFPLRDTLSRLTETELEDEDYRGVADGVLAWWRSDDGDVDDLSDYLMDCAQSFADGAGIIWLMVPQSQSEFAVFASDVNDAAKAAGQSVTSSKNFSAHWTAFRITAHGR